MVDERYTYHVHPFKPIPNLVKGKTIFKACALKLNKSEVKHAMKFGTIYRAFPDHDVPVRVTGDEIDKYHVATYEEAINPKKEEDSSSEEIPVVEPSTNEESTENALESETESESTDTVVQSSFQNEEDNTEPINEETEHAESKSFIISEKINVLSSPSENTKEQVLISGGELVSESDSNEYRKKRNKKHH